MYCSKCGKPLQAGAEFCPHCGARLEAPSREPLQRERFPRLPGVLLSIGVGLALLIFLISWSVYGRMYFFDGYAITGIGWSLSFGLSAAGILLAVILPRAGPMATCGGSLLCWARWWPFWPWSFSAPPSSLERGAALRPMSPAPILRRIPTNPAIAHRSTSRPFIPTT